MSTDAGWPFTVKETMENLLVWKTDRISLLRASYRKTGAGPAKKSPASAGHLLQKKSALAGVARAGEAP
jgi:hypothetical protein